MSVSTKIGFANIGNTCFLNVVLQALRLSPPMGEIFLGPKELQLRPDSKKQAFARAFQILLQDLWRISPPPEARPTMVPRGFFQSLTNVLKDTEDGWYHHGQQADAAEALQYILDSLHDGMYRRVRMTVAGQATTREETSHTKALTSWSTFFEKEYSPIVNHFNGQTQICVQCDRCKSVSERYEPWLMLKAPIPNAETVGGPVPTMEACLEAAFVSETLDDYQCDTCKSKQKATITNRISRLPSVVILSVKRFTNTGHKVRGRIPWDLDALDFTPQMAFTRDPFTNTRRSPIYETYAVIEHHGSTHGGHYIMFAKQDNVWYEYDDNSVSTSDPERVVSPDSYILMLVPKASAPAMSEDFRSHILSFRAKEEAAKKVAVAPAAEASAAEAPAAEA